VSTPYRNMAIAICLMATSILLEGCKSATSQATDHLDGQRFHRFATSPTFTQDFQRTVHGRVLYVGFVYSFGSTKKDKQPNFEYDQ